MSDTTTNYGLKKPIATEYFTVEDQNGNMDLIDATLKNNADDIAVEETARAAADTALGNLISTKSDKSSVVTATLVATSWTGSAAPYTYTLAVSGVTATSNQELLPAASITAAQLKAMQSANIQDGGQAVNSITLKAYGIKPTIDLPVRVIKRGDA